MEEVRASSSPIGTDVGSKTGWLRVDPAYLVLALLPWLVFEARTLGAGTIDSGGIPTEEWAFCKYQSDGLHVTTNSGRFSYSVQYAPFTTVKAGFYRFVLRYDHLNGGLLFGALSGDQSHWVVPPEAGRKGRSGTKTAYLSLESGEQLVLMVCNFSAYAPNHSSTFVIKSVRALPLSISSVSQFRIPKSMPLAPAVDIADAMMSSWLSR